MGKATKPSNIFYSSNNIENHLDRNVKLVITQQDSSLVVTFERNVSTAFNKQLSVLFFTTMGVFSVYWIISVTFCIYYLLFAMLYFLFQVAGNLKQESLVIVRSLGYQITTKYALGQRTLFIPWDRVERVFINEVILRDKVIPVLTLLSKDNNELIPLFLGVKPYLQSLEIIFKCINKLRS